MRWWEEENRLWFVAYDSLNKNKKNDPCAKWIAKIICSVRCILVAQNLWQWQFKCLTFLTTFCASILLHASQKSCMRIFRMKKKKNKKKWAKEKKIKELVGGNTEAEKMNACTNEKVKKKINRIKNWDIERRDERRAKS